MTTPENPNVVLVPGFWLGAWAWDRVVPALRAAGLVPHAVTLSRPDDLAREIVAAARA